MKNRNPLKLMLSYALFYTTSLAKVSLIIGSKLAFFSFASIAAPLIGVFGGLGVLLGVGLIKIGFSFLFGYGILFSLLNFLPHMAAANYFNSDSVFKLVLPLAAMAIFIVHPEGSFIYALLWLIPVVCYFSKNNIFAKSLGATFSAHAVGSVVWLFTVPMMSAMWPGIIFVALLERLLFALGISIAYYAISSLRLAFVTKVENFNLKA
jgi:hypothetical protein